MKIHCSNIYTSKNVMMVDEHYSNLAKSILNYGQKVPVSVMRSGPGRYTVVDGNRRVITIEKLSASGLHDGYVECIVLSNREEKTCAHSNTFKLVNDHAGNDGKRHIIRREIVKNDFYISVHSDSYKERDLIANRILNMLNNQE